MSLEEIIIDNPLNKKNLNELLDSYDRDLFVPFIGAGPSTVLGEPDWKGLFSKLRKSLGAKYVRSKKLPDGSIDYPVAFSKLFQQAPDQEKFYPELFKIIEPTKTSATFFHLKLVKAFDSYITTNYDSSIEEAFNEAHPDRKLNKQYFSSYKLDKMHNCIVYLHGHKDINFCIIKSEDYDYFYPSIGGNSGGIPILEDFLTEVFTKRSIIFVGFSFDDKYITKLFQHIAANGTQSFFHYWLLKESSEAYSIMEKESHALRKRGNVSEAESVQSKFYAGELNIKPIIYRGEYHIFSQRLFEKLLESKSTDITPGNIGGIPVGQ